MIKNRFALDAPLDQVRFGTLYTATDTDPAAAGPYRHIALWRLPDGIGKQRAALGALARDFVRVRQLSHPSIARVYHLDRDGETYFVTGELLDGETLRNVVDHLRPERLEPGEVDAILQTLGDALEYAHSHGVVHGEVGTSNVVVTMNHEVKLTNFLEASVTRSAPFPPKPADDVRGLASLAYELYTGVPLQRRSRPIRVPGLPRRRAKAIAAVLDQKPSRRDWSIAEFLEAAGLEGAVTGTAAETPRRASGWGRRAAVPLAALAAAAIAAYVVGGKTGMLGEGVTRFETWSADMIGRFTAPAARPSTTAGLAEAAPSPEPSSTGASEPAAERPNLAVPIVLRPNAAPPAPRPEPAEPPENDANPRTAPEEPALSFATANVTAHEGQSAVTIDIVRSGDTSGSAAVVWWTSDGTAHARDDYASFGRRIERFAPGETVRRLYIPIAADSVPEPDEYFEVHLGSKPEGGRLGRITTAKVTLIDDDL